MSTLSSRRRPYPWDARLTVGQTQGLMLVPNDQGLLVGRKQTNLNQAVPPVMDYGSAPVYKEHTFDFRPTGGMGESVQSGRTDRRYHYGVDVWVTGGLWGVGPKSHSIVPTAGGAFIRRFIEAMNAGQLTLFFLVGANVMRRSDDSNSGQIISLNRPGFVAMDAARFTGAYAGAADSLYVSWSDGDLTEYNGSTWTTATLPANFQANLIQVVGDELWAADTTRCHLRKCTNDPKVGGSWSGPILVGTPSIPITAIRQTTNRLTIFKADGSVFTINGDGSDNDLFPGLQTTVDPENGRTAWPWQGSLWFRTGRAFWQLDMQGGAVLTPTGPGRQLGNLSEVRGPVQAFVGWNSQMAFGAIYNQTLNASYLLTFGNWAQQQGDEGTDYVFKSQWDGAVVKWAGRKVTALWVSAIPYDARLYVGFADGGYDWIKLVAYPLTPASGAEYTDDVSYLVAPVHHDMFESNVKHYVGFSIFGPFFPNDGRVDVNYRLRGGKAGLVTSDPSGGWLEDTDGFTFNGQRENLVAVTAATAIELKIDLHKGLTDTPILEGLGLHERLVPEFRLDYSMTIDARDVVARRDGASQRQSGKTVRNLVSLAAAQPATVSLELPDETVRDIAMFDYVERMVPRGRHGGQGWAIDIQATEFAIQAIYGTIGRTRGTSIGSLRGWQISMLRYF